VDLTGKRFGRLVVLAIGERTPNGHKWVCACDCGQGASVLGSNLRTGRQVSCGCFSRESKRARITHGESSRVRPNAANRRGESVEYRTWAGMKRRCFNPNDHHFYAYGARGITVCDEWAGPGGFERFLAHVGRRPSDAHSIDRIDNDRGYEPGNVRWATDVEQANNHRRNRMLTARDRTQTMSQWARELGADSRVIDNRLRQGWTVERAVTEPVRRRAA